MTNDLKPDLKPILLKIACLSRADQGWIIDKLSKTQSLLFNKVKGEQLLQSARRFRKLKYKDQPLLTAKPHLPSYCQRLAKHSPLYIALVLEQGQFSWEKEFLTSVDCAEPIKNAALTQLKQIKPVSKMAVFNHWQNSLTFAAHLETAHG